MNERCWQFGHRWKLIGRLADGKGVHRCRRCKMLDRSGDWVPCKPGRIEAR